MLLYICPGDDGLPGAVREEQREVERDADGDFLEMILSQALTETSLLAIPEVGFTHTGSQRVLPKISVSLPGTATGDITPHCPPPLERPGGSDQPQKDVSRDGNLWVSNRERPGLMDSIM